MMKLKYKSDCRLLNAQTAQLQTFDQNIFNWFELEVFGVLRIKLTGMNSLKTEKANTFSSKHPYLFVRGTKTLKNGAMSESGALA